MEAFVGFLILAGGVALLLFGVRYLRKGVDRLFGMRLGVWMQRVGDQPGRAFFTGLGVAALAPSSTTISLLAVQAVQAGYMNARQMLSVVLGANIGLTVMVQLVALELDEIAPILILFGVILFQYTTGTRLRGIGQVILSLGLIFLGIGIIKSAVPGEVAPDSDLGQLITIASHYPALLAILAAVLAMVAQSSTATIGLVIGLIAAGAIGYDVAIPVVIGANVGLSVTTLLIAWRQIESRRLAMGNLSMKVIVALPAMATLPLIINLLEHMPGSMTTQIACVHTGFNIVVAMIGLPLIAMTVRLLERTVPDDLSAAADVFGPRYIKGGPIGGVTVALGQSLREILHVSEIVRSMLDDLWRALKRNDESLALDVARRDDQVDLLDEEIKRFLTRTIKDDAEATDANEQLKQLRYLSELETIGDIIDKNLSELVIKKIRLGASFSEEGQKELGDFKRKVAENLLIAETVFNTRDRALARQLLDHKEALNKEAQRLRDTHFARLNRGLTESHETSAIHLDMLTHLKRINSGVTHVAYAILRDADQAESSVKHPDTAE